ncbi:MAG: c-type cytochrome [Gallionellaceae bacterium]|nr:c-type cytochrome [Gallionellaceae bacterium]MDD5365075.1 c-type cytochrome [Gallionellaceae bacterium]
MKVTLIVAALLALSGTAMADQKLAQSKACLSCHQIDKKVVGPAFKDVANKYKGDAKAEEHLLGVIQKGGKGVWGNVPMPPQPGVKPDEAEALVKWVLSL